MQTTKQRWPRPSEDAERVAALQALGILDGPLDKDLEGLVRVAAYVCGTPSAAVNLIDQDRQWAAATYGPAIKEIPRDESLCGWSITQPGVTYTPDASHDPAFESHPYVTGRKGAVRLYAAAPILIEPGYVLGSLCAFGEEAGTLSSLQRDRLTDLAKAVARILEQHRTLGTLACAAVHDPLTDLRNREIFDLTLHRALGLYRQGACPPGLLYLDLDGFKPVNDTHGHQAGDAVLRTLAGRMQSSVRGTDMVARIGGDEFVILVQDPGALDTAERLRVISNRLMARLQDPVTVGDGAEVTVSASVGLAVARQSDTPETLIRRADEAMYAMKTSLQRGESFTGMAR